jgi:Na+-translocating ferredoxin:NAD+ oxidoreductase RnfA subunit
MPAIGTMLWEFIVFLHLTQNFHRLLKLAQSPTKGMFNVKAFLNFPSKTIFEKTIIFILIDPTKETQFKILLIQKDNPSEYQDLHYVLEMQIYVRYDLDF